MSVQELHALASSDKPGEDFIVVDVRRADIEVSAYCDTAIVTLPLWPSV
jgi:hypothetical protein